MTTSSFIPAGSGSCSMRPRSAPVMQPATPRVIPAEALAVTKPASPPVSRATTALAFRWRSVISTNSGRISVTARIASGTTIDAPSAVMVPDTLMIGRSPSRRRMSGWRSSRAVTGGSSFAGGASVVLELDPAEKRAESLVVRIRQDLPRRARRLDAAAVHEDDPGGDIPRERHLVGHDDHGHAVGGQLPDDGQHLADELGVERRGDLVEEQHLGLHGHRPRDPHPLLLAPGQLDREAPELVGEPDPREPALPRPPGVVPGQAPDLPEAERHVLERGQVREQVEELEHHADVGTDLRELG